ncbi:MAG: hypothetical protein ABS75_16455 [Pelagibacterium sp. SCN 63-23]|nr:MAG: hypothetical protein ABS75_16455 [Pelagibacterium sp. SCN 63-23]
MQLNIAFLDDTTRPAIPKLEGLTEAQRQPGRHLKQIHDHLRHNMQTLAALIERANAGDIKPEDIADQTGNLAMVANYRRFGNFCGQYCQVVHNHHTIEDHHFFPVLAQQGEAFRKIAERLQAEHVVVHEVLVQLIDALNALASEPGPENFARARRLYQALETVLLSHLGYEEEAIGDALGYFEIM